MNHQQTSRIFLTGAEPRDIWGEITVESVLAYNEDRIRAGLWTAGYLDMIFEVGARDVVVTDMQVQAVIEATLGDIMRLHHPFAGVALVTPIIVNHPTLEDGADTRVHLGYRPFNDTAVFEEFVLGFNHPVCQMSQLNK